MKILVTDSDFPDLALERDMAQAAGITLVSAQCRSEAQIIEAAQGCEGLLVQYAPVGKRVFAACPDLRIVSRYGAGFDTINLDDARAHGVWVTNSPDYGVGEVATHALAMTLTLLRHVSFYDRQIKSGQWHFQSAGKIRRVGDLTLGILGLGRIGKRMAHVARNSFAQVIASDPYLIDGDFPAYVKRVDTETLFAQADAISLHVPLNDETRNMVDHHLLQRMKKGSVLVNTARGGLIVIDDLLAALDNGTLDGAALDVLPIEPPEFGSAVVQHPRIVLTPHAAFYSTVAEQELRRKAMRNLVEWHADQRPSYVVVCGKPR